MTIDRWIVTIETWTDSDSVWLLINGHILTIGD